MASPAPTLLNHVNATLGEGPVWYDNKLIWVDIPAGEAHSLDPCTGRRRCVDIGEPVGAVAPREDGMLVAATRSGFILVDPRRGTVEMIAQVETDMPSNRMNDGKCDSRGRLWAGTQSEQLTPGAGGLYRLDLDGTVSQQLDGLTIPNGLGWSPSDRLFYLIDTAERALDAFDYCPDAGTISNRRRLVEFDPAGGEPDGLAVDLDGFIWVALWNGWGLHRYSPSGDLDRSLKFPVSHVTSCAFGGPELERLFVTTAALDQETRIAQPLAGALFEVDPPAPGLPVPMCRVLT